MLQEVEQAVAVAPRPASTAARHSRLRGRVTVAQAWATAEDRAGGAGAAGVTADLEAAGRLVPELRAAQKGAGAKSTEEWEKALR